MLSNRSGAVAFQVFQSFLQWHEQESSQFGTPKRDSSRSYRLSILSLETPRLDPALGSRLRLDEKVKFPRLPSGPLSSRMFRPLVQVHLD